MEFLNFHRKLPVLTVNMYYVFQENTPRSSQQWSEPFSIKKLQEKFSNSALSRFMSGNNQFIENDAFEDIGDEDL